MGCGIDSSLGPKDPVLPPKPEIGVLSRREAEAVATYAVSAASDVGCGLHHLPPCGHQVGRSHWPGVAQKVRYNAQARHCVAF